MLELALLRELTQVFLFREDGKSSMKFYTDPSYFAELWAVEMGKQIQENKRLHEQRRKRNEVSVQYCLSLEIYDG